MYNKFDKIFISYFEHTFINLFFPEYFSKVHIMPSLEVFKRCVDVALRDMVK